MTITSTRAAHAPKTDLRRPQGVAQATGRGQASGHHGEILQAAIPMGADVQRVLVTLPCRALRSEAVFVPDPSLPLTLRPESNPRPKALQAAALTLETLGHAVGGTLEIGSNIPWGAGLGSSTADVVAAIRAVNDAFGGPLCAPDIARIAVVAETETSPAMYPDQVTLFSQRLGEVVEVLGQSLPRVTLLSVDIGERVDSVQLPIPDYSRDQLETFRVLIGLLRRSVHNRCAVLLGRVATASARINQEFLAKPLFEELVRVTDEAGGVGVQVAHTGSVTGLMFRSGDASAVATASEHLTRMAIPFSRLGSGDLT